MASGHSSSKRGKGKCTVVCDTKACRDDDPGNLNNMFGSLFGVAHTPEEKRIQLTENWHRIIRRWYPDLHDKVNCVPPVHFRQVSYKPRPAQPSEPYERFGMLMYQHPHDSTMKGDEAQQRVLSTFSTFCRRKSGTAFILSNMEFQNYLSKDYCLPNSAADFPKPCPREDGEIDVLIIDKKNGIFVVEVKSIDDQEKFQGKDQIEELSKKLRSAEKQIKTQCKILKRLISDLNVDEQIKIKAALAFPNFGRQNFEEALARNCFSSNDDPRTSPEKLKQITFCAEEFPKRHSAGESIMSQEIFVGMDNIWTNLETVYGSSKQLDNDLYEQIVARFCGPLTTVKIYTEKNYPRVRLQTEGQRSKPKLIPEESVSKAGAARIVARRFSELVLLQDQIDVLQRNDDFVHLEGPPGTGKTLVLLLRILTWLDEGHMVWLVSLSPPSRSVTHVLKEQVEKMIVQYHSEEKAKELKGRIQLFMRIRDESTLDEEYYRRQLLKFRERAKCAKTRPYVGYPRPPTLPPVTTPHDRKVCLVLDECGMSGTGLQAFFNQVSELHRAGEFCNKTFDKGLSVWSASLEVVGRPCYVTEPDKTSTEKFGVLWTLKLPIRCPPTVQRALLLVQPHLDQENVCCFKKESILPNPTGHLYAADGLPVFLIAHGSHRQSGMDIWHCKECGEDLGSYLQNKLHIGKEQCTCKDKGIQFDREGVEAKCPDCGKLEKGSLPACDRPLKHNDVMIVATQRAFQMSVPISGFVNALAKRNLKVSINTTREEGDTPIPPDDVILIADLTSIHGLERAIIIIIPEVNAPAQAPEDQEMTFNPVTLGGSEHLQDWTAAPEAASDKDPDADSGAVVDKSHLSIVPAITKDDPAVKSGMEKGEENMHITDDGTDYEYAGAVMNSEAGKTDSGDPPRKATKRKLQTETEESVFVRQKAAKQTKDLFTYADCHSQQQIKAALDSLSLQSQRDVFYIGSRAVCQLILIHLLGNDHLQNAQPTEPMQTD